MSYPQILRGENLDISYSVQFSSVTRSCLTLCNPVDCSTPGLPVHHQLLKLAQTHVLDALIHRPSRGNEQRHEGGKVVRFVLSIIIIRW